MTAAASTNMERLVTLLGGWPAHFTAQEIRHGESLLAVLRRDKIVDEVAFGLTVRYATHRAAYDRLSAEIAEEAAADLAQGVKAKEADTAHFLSGKEQSRAFHANKVLTIERELLATPYARAKSGQSTQTSFMDLLNADPPKGGGGPATVMPFRKFVKRGQS
jgi:hypothetical protein